MKRASVNWLPPLAALVVFLLHVGLMYRAALHHTEGTISYPIDDAFIHLALARQIVENGVYGITPHEFASVSSSIGWPLLLAFCIKVAGLKAWWPLALNVVFGIGLVLIGDRVVRRFVPDVSGWRRFVVSLLVIVLTPMATLVILGMEHTAHAFAMIGFIGETCVWLAADAPKAQVESRLSSLPIRPMLWAAFLTLWRYEGIFPIAIVFALSCLRRRFVQGVAIAVAGAIPVVVFGIYLKVRYGAFLPLPVILKGRHIAIHDPTDLLDLFGGDLMNRLGQEPHVLAVAVLVAGAAVLTLKREGLWSAISLALIVVFGSLLFHVEFASLGWFFRYESYLMATGLVFGAIAILRVLPAVGTMRAAMREKPVYAALAVLGLLALSAPLFRRASQANASTPLACQNVFQQQMQSARFLGRYFDDGRVAVNDIGAVAWVGHEEIVDLMGLATLSVAKAKGMRLDTSPSVADLERLTAGVDVAIIYDEWFAEGVPARWLRLGRWRIDSNRSCAFPAVSIYGTNPQSYAKVIDALRAFSKSLPKGVWQEGRYLDHDLASDEWIRVGDRLLVNFTGRPELSGSFDVKPDGSIQIRHVGPVIVRGLTPDEARAAISRHIAEVRGAQHLADTAVADLRFVRSRTPSVLVAGHVRSAVEVTGTPTFENAIAAAGALEGTADEARPWVWRETRAGFVKQSQSEIGSGGLLDGDIVVVP